MNTGKKKAIVIGVSSYDSANLFPLDFCENDGNEMYQTLTSLGYEVKDGYKLIGKVGGEDMRDAIIDFFVDPSIRANDILVFYYSGHGIPDTDEEVFLASSDIDPAVPNKRGFPFRELTSMMQKSVSTRVVTILDCCYSGAAKVSKGVLGGSKAGDDAAKLGARFISKGSSGLPSGEGKCLLAASLSYQEAYGLKEGGHSIFTHYLLSGLKGTKESIDVHGNVTPDTLGRYLYEKVTSVAPQQKPIRKVEASGDIILASYPDLALKEAKYSEPMIATRSTKSVVRSTLKECNAFLEKKRFDDAIECYDSLLHENPDDVSAWKRKGTALEQLLRYDEALKCYNRAVEVSPDDPNTWYNRGNCLYHLGRFNEAIWSYEKTLEIAPNDADCWYNKGCTLLKLSRQREGKQCIEKAHQLSATNN